jgi:hypothetical protein
MLSRSQLVNWLVINDPEFQGQLAEFQADCDFANELSKVSPEIPGE